MFFRKNEFYTTDNYLQINKTFYLCLCFYIDYYE